MSITYDQSKFQSNKYRTTIQQASTLSEVAQARPHRSKGAPARSHSHYTAILELLRERAQQGRGVLGSELYEHPESYGRSPRNRISELRRDGYIIEGKPNGSADWFYKLIRDNTGENPLSNSSDWYEQKAGKQRPAQPALTEESSLFSGMR